MFVVVLNPSPIISLFPSKFVRQFNTAQNGPFFSQSIPKFQQKMSGHFSLVCPLFLLSAILVTSIAGHQPSSSSTNNRAKRFAGLGGPLSTVGGNLGCVVSQDKLYINGRFTKSLEEDEQEEMREYRKALSRFQEEVKSFLAQQQKQFQLAESEAKAAFLQQKKQPEPPKRPSFCSEKATTQFVFDGCTVQGESVFIGDSFVRKLTADEQRELARFEEQFTAYQEAITAGFKKQMEQFFGRQFGPLFGGANSTGTDLKGKEGRSGNGAAEMEGGEGGGEGAPKRGQQEAPIPKEPKAPEFCTLVA